MNKAYTREIVLWFLPAVMLIISLFPIDLPAIYGLLVQIIVSLTAAIIAYLLFTKKPQYFIIWGIVFVLIVLIYNPFIKIAVFSNSIIPISLITAIIFIANWWFVFHKK